MWLALERIREWLGGDAGKLNELKGAFSGKGAVQKLQLSCRQIRGTLNELELYGLERDISDLLHLLKVTEPIIIDY